MSKKNFDRMIRENQKRNHINLRLFTIASKAVEADKEENENTKKSKHNNKMNKNKKFKSSINMALRGSRQTVEGDNGFKFYVGIAPIGCKTVCPTKDQLSQMLGREWPKDMVYVKNDPNGIQQVNLTFPLTVDTTIDNREIHLMILQTIALKNAPAVKTDGTKFQVIDKWGECAWVTEEEFNNHTWPLSSSGKKLKIDPSNWRKAYKGEDNLMKFLKPRMNVDNPFGYDKESGFYIKSNIDASNCECRLDNIANYFKGDFSEIQIGLNIMPENKVKGYLYVDEYEGKQRQAVAREYVNLASNRYNDLETEIARINDNKGTNFTLCELQEYKVESTQFAPSTNQMPVTDNPFATNNSPWAE